MTIVRPRGRAAPSRAVSPDDVMATVLDLADPYHPPSTSLIVWRLAPGGSASSAFESAVREALEHLCASGRLLRVVHRGTHRWSPALRGERSEA
jgi:hypothetical protein